MVQETLGSRLRGVYRWVSGTTWAERTAALLAVFVLVFSVYTGTVELNRQGRSREVLAQVKAARLAGSAISASCYSTGAAFADQTSADGFAPGIADEIKKLGSLPGEITLLQVDTNHYTIHRLLYREGDLYALYDSTDGYSVWRADARLSYALTGTGAG